jgi:hypothetical protein
LGHFGPFRYCSKVDAELAELAPLAHKFAKQSCVGIFLQQTHLIQSIRPKTHVSGHFGPFHYCTKVVEKLVEHVPLTHNFAN